MSHRSGRAGPRRAHVCCGHIDTCEAVIAVGGGLAERIHAEIDQARRDRLARAITEQAGRTETLRQMIGRGTVEPSRLIRINAKEVEGS